MPNNHKNRYQNYILRRLSSEDIALLEPKFEHVQLPLRMILEEAQLPIEFVYFIEAGIGSIVANTLNGRETEVGLIGFDGMTGSAVILGDDQSVHQCYVQMALGRNLHQAGVTSAR